MQRDLEIVQSFFFRGRVVVFFMFFYDVCLQLYDFQIWRRYQEHTKQHTGNKFESYYKL